MHLDDTKHGIDTIEDEEADESFPASDPPSWSGMHIGAPCPADTGDDDSGTTGGSGSTGVAADSEARKPNDNC